MPIPPVTQPYDTLETVTSLVRTILADHIANINPAPQGTANVNGTAVTWVSGPQFSLYFNGVPFSVNGVGNQVAQVNSPTSITLATAAAVGAGVPWVASIPTGDIFADSQNYVLPTTNLGWRKLHEKLDISSHPRLRGDAIISNLPVAASQDPSTQQWINWTNFFDGVNLLSPATNPAGPVLPADFMSPLRIEERPSTSSGVPNNLEFTEMNVAVESLPLIAKGTRNRLWDWRMDKIFMIGARVQTDWHLIYRSYLGDLTVAQGGFSSTQVPIMRCARALAYYTAEAFVIPRGGQMLAGDFAQKGDDAVESIATIRQAKLGQRSNARRVPVYVSGNTRWRGFR